MDYSLQPYNRRLKVNSQNRRLRICVPMLRLFTVDRQKVSVVRKCLDLVKLNELVRLTKNHKALISYGIYRDVKAETIVEKYKIKISGELRFANAKFNQSQEAFIVDQVPYYDHCIFARVVELSDWQVSYGTSFDCDGENQNNLVGVPIDSTINTNTRFWRRKLLQEKERMK